METPPKDTQPQEVPQTPDKLAFSFPMMVGLLALALVFGGVGGYMAGSRSKSASTSTPPPYAEATGGKVSDSIPESDKTATPSTTQSPTPIDEMDGWEIFENKQYNYKLKYPTDSASPNAVGGQDPVFSTHVHIGISGTAIGKDEEASLFINTHLSDYYDKFTPKEFFEDFVFNNNLSVNEKGEKLINGELFYWGLTEGHHGERDPDGELPTNTQLMACTRKDVLYCLSLIEYRTSVNEAKSLDIFDQILSTFEFTN